MKNCLYFVIGLLAFAAGSSNLVWAQGELFFREDWREIEAELPVTQKHVAHEGLELGLYGPGRDAIKKSNHPHIPNDPYYIWSGECRANWAVGLRLGNQHVDLTQGGMIRIRSRQSGFRELRIMLKLHTGEWLVSNESAGYTEDWSEKTFKVSDMRWRKLDIERITEAGWVNDPDLTRVEEIGFTDLMSGGGTPASSRLDWIEVYGKAVKVKR